MRVSRSVAQKIKAAGRTLVGIGTRKNTNKHWAKSRHEFRYYDSLVGPEPPAEAKPAEGKEASPAPPADPATDVLRRAVHLLAESKGEPWVNKTTVWPMIKRLDLSFDPKDHGHASFGEMLKALDTVVEVRKGDADHQLRLKS